MTAFAKITTPELLTFAALLVLTGRSSRQSIYDLMARDSTFPRPVQVGSKFSIAWRRGEVMAWINALPRAEQDGLNAIERRQRAKQERESAATATQ